MSDRLKQRYYRNSHSFKADMQRMFYNCRQFNADNTPYYKAGVELEAYFVDLWTQAGL